jgi:ABC-2 type transport system ATP-binding protein
MRVLSVEIGRVPARVLLGSVRGLAALDRFSYIAIVSPSRSTSRSWGANVIIVTAGLRKSFTSRGRPAKGGSAKGGSAKSGSAKSGSVRGGSAKSGGLAKGGGKGAGHGSKTVEAVRGVNLKVAEGEIFGFLGPNGAGKTTTLRMLATLIVPDGGEAVIAGADLRREPGEVRRRIGYVAQGGSTWDEVSAREELVLHARMYGIGKAEAHRRAGAALEAFDLAEYADRPCKTYSGGQRRRVDIALGVIHEPTVVFLDEPTTGLDPQSRAHMWDEVRRLRQGGMTVFLTTHYLDEADALCDRVAIIDNGEIVAEGTPADLKRDISGDVVTVGLRGTGSVAQAAGLLDSHVFVNKLETSDAGLRLYVDDGAVAIPQILRSLDAGAIPLVSIELHRPSLDDVFLEKTGRSLRES